MQFGRYGRPFPELNLLDWELTLAPGEKRVVRFDFTVEHPREMSLIGLP